VSSSPAPSDRDAHVAAQGRDLNDYDKGFLDGLLEASRHAGPEKRLEAYKADAERYLADIGHPDWSVNVKRI
jgi:hypothetical protein